ncbi:hypothetical protein [Anaerospora hongkongensis]|uniref:hypothetical protein n=1 Tax=Anaerospora hongkongensis TaxID=244830 RepID=UPI00289B49C5|nr:hypothetical protein [Anaerospora hongkongensis]
MNDFDDEFAVVEEDEEQLYPNDELDSVPPKTADAPKPKAKTLVLPCVPITDYYKLLEDAYAGSGGFLNGDYLVPHVRETLDKYTRRKALSYYANYVKTVVNGLVNPIFRKQATRNWEGKDSESQLFSKFQADVDRKGTNIKRFMKKALKKAKLHGVCFIVVDNVKEQPATKAGAMEKRAFPYAYIVSPKQVKNYECNEDGVLTSITYETYSRRFSGNAASNIITRWTWTETAWKCERDGKTEEQEHGLGVVPVIPLFGVDADDGDMLPTGDMLAIARINLAIFNLCSELRELLRNQAFSILCYPVTENSDHEGLDDLVTGTENALNFDGNGSAPLYITPPAEQAELLQKELSRLVEEIYRLATLSSVVGVQQKTSGVSKAWDFENTNQSLSDMAENCQEAEMKMAYLFEKWVKGTTINYSCVYPDDFGIVDITEALDEITKALDLQIGGLFQKEVKKKAVETYLADLPENRFDAVMNDIDKQTEEVQQADAFRGA